MYVIFKIVYLLLALQQALFFWGYKVKRLPPWADLLRRGLSILTFPLVRPFQRIFFFPVEVAPLIALLLLLYLIEPIVRTLWG
jgi:hypothetical protein